MAGMDRPQFSLMRVMLAMTCFAVSFAAYLWLRDAVAQARPRSPLLEVLFVFLPAALSGLAIGMLCRQKWTGVAFVAYFVTNFGLLVYFGVRLLLRALK